MDNLQKFLKNGVIEFGSIIDKQRCKQIYDEVANSRELSGKLFRSEEDF